MNSTNRRLSTGGLLLTAANLVILLVNLQVSRNDAGPVSRAARPFFRGSFSGTKNEHRAASPHSKRAPEASRRTAVANNVAAKLSDRDMERLLESLYIESRVRTRTNALLHALNRLVERRELRALDTEMQALLVSSARSFTAARAKLERELGLEAVPNLDNWERRLQALDDDWKSRMEKRFSDSLNATERTRVLRLLVPGRYTTASVK